MNIPMDLLCGGKNINKLVFINKMAGFAIEDR